MRTYGRLSMHAALAGALLLCAPAAHAQQKVLLPEKDRALDARPTPVYSVGEMEGREWEMFANVTQVAFDAADNLYVLDSGAQRVLVFDRAGRFVRQVGKKGGGPGELQAPMSLAVGPDGTVTLSDLGHRAYVVYGSDGTYRTSIPFAEGTLAGMTARSHPRGGVVTLQRPFGFPGTGGGTGSVGQETALVWQTVAGEPRATTLFRAEEEMRVNQSSGGAPGGGTSRRVTVSGPPAFTPQLNWDVLPDGGLAVSNTPGYTVRVVSPEGKTVRYLQKPMKVRRVTERDRERARQRTREQMTGGEGAVAVRVTAGGGGGGTSVSVGGGGARGAISPERIEERVKNMEFAEVIPAIQNVRADRKGRLWIERTGTEWGDPGPIDVVTAEGRYLGTLQGERLPAAFSPSGRTAYVERDDLGVQRVVVRQLPAALR